MKQENWEEKFDNFGEIWTTYFGVHSVKGLSQNWNMSVNAECQTKTIKDFIQNLLQQQKEEIIEKIKEKSKKLPIEIEKTNSDYRQGMHAGLDLAIDDIIKLLKE